MSDFKKKTDQSKLFLFSKTEEEFTKEYQQHDATTAKNLYLQMLLYTNNAVKCGNNENFKKICKLIKCVQNIEDRETIRSYHCDTDNSIQNTNLIILACKHNKFKILRLILSESRELLDILFPSNRDNLILPDHKDEENHNAFYYAIRSGKKFLFIFFN